MLQKELAKRLKARYDTKMDGNEWMEVSSDGIPLCRIKYNGQFLSNADQNLSDEYRSKIADIQDEISTVREYIYLADRTNENNECWPAIPTIAADLKYSPSTVRRGIRDIKKAGVLTTEQRYREKGGKSSLLFRLKKE